MPRTLGPMHMSNNRAYELQRTNNFEIQITGLGEDITFACEGFPLPSIGNPPLEVPYGNSKVKLAGQAEYEDGDLVLRDFIGADIERQINEWHKQVYDPETDKVGFAADYKRMAFVYEFAPDGSNVRTWKLLGCWPSRVVYGEMSNEDSNKKLITVTLSYDKAFRV